MFPNLQQSGKLLSMRAISEMSAGEDALWSLLIVGFIILLSVFVRYCMIQNIYQSLEKNAPKVDTNICDKNHVYPKELALKLDSSQLMGVMEDVELCPICYNENMNRLSKVPDAETTNAEPGNRTPSN